MMKMKMNQTFDVSSVGKLYWKSLAVFAHRLEDKDGREISLDDLDIDQTFFVIFPSGTGLTRTSAVRTT